MEPQSSSSVQPVRPWDWLAQVLFYLGLLGLPLTSLPLITRLTGATVAPFSAIPFILLGLFWFLPYLLRRGKLPREIVPFLVFTLLVVALAALAFFNVDQTFRDRPLLSQTLRTFIPFGSGLVFFLIASTWPQDAVRLRRSLQWIQVGGFLLLGWSVAQAVVMFRLNDNYPAWMEILKNALVTQSNLSNNGRLAGLTWEASWFAHQLNMLYLPIWLAATYQRTTVFPRIWKISLENIALLLGVGVFFLSSPRIGGVAFMLALLFLFLKFNLALYRWFLRFLARRWPPAVNRRPLRLALGLLVALVFLGIYAGFGAGVFKLASARDWRVGLITKSSFSPAQVQQILSFNENSLYFVGLRFAFLERTIYWMDGWHIFNDHPFLGVGLGNAGYYFFDHLSAIGWSSYEIRTLMFRDTSLPNTKSMWYRLLAETGLPGFAIFLAWLLAVWQSAGHLLRHSDAAVRTLALAGQIALVAYIFEGFSVDTFGLPYLFIITGLTAAAAMFARKPIQSNE